MADAGHERLRATLEEFSAALQAFDDPVVDQVAGLRLMRSALRERAEHMRAQVTAAETASLEVAVEAAPGDAAGLPLPLAVGLLDALQDAVTATGLALAAGPGGEGGAGQADTAAALVLRLTGYDGEALQLQRRPGPSDTQLVAPDSGDLLVERALDVVVAVLEAAGDADPLRERAGELPAAAAAPLARLAQLLAASPVRLRLRLQPGGMAPRTAVVTRADAQALSAALGGAQLQAAGSRRAGDRA